MEKGTLIGLILAVLSFSAATVMSAWPNLAIIGWMIDGASFALVIVGAFASTMIAMPFDIFKAALKAQSLVMKPPKFNATVGINQIVALANTARKEGVLALEDSAANMDDAFLKKGIMLIVDGTDPDLVKGIMETEMAYIEERHGNIAGVFDNLGAFAPSWGMKGTLIGLVVMLGDLDDMAAIGPAMATALLTTFWGAIAANAWFIPFSSKLKLVSKEEILLKTVLIEGMLSIQAGENPRIIEEKLKSFLSPMMRDEVGVGESGGGGE